jgi:hypothetical protein
LSEPETQIDTCDFLFLTEIQELGGNRLRIVVHEGKPTGASKTITVGGSAIRDCTSIEITAESAAFEFVWPHYVAYAVLNESYASPPNAEQSFKGRRFRIYEKSYFRDYLSRSTFATDEYPGPLLHFEICCEDQIVNVVSTVSPTITTIVPLTDPERRQSFRM